MPFLLIFLLSLIIFLFTFVARCIDTCTLGIDCFLYLPLGSFSLLIWIPSSLRCTNTLQNHHLTFGITFYFYLSGHSVIQPTDSSPGGCMAI